MKNLYKKIIVSTLVITFIFSPIFASKAEAQWVVWDPGNFVPNLASQVKDYGLDAVAWAIVDMIISRMAASTVKWINSGFNGAPAYVTDPTKYFGSIGDGIAGQYIMTNPNLDFLCGPISAKVRIALSNSYNRSDNLRWQCTLTEVGKNLEDFMGDFEKGGWDSFFKLTQERQNNPIGAYLQAEGDLFDQIATKATEKDKELSWGSGFMSSKECIETGPAVEMPIYDTKGNIISSYLIPGPCLKEKTETPGSVIESKLNETIGQGAQRLNVADEINEIVSALLNQLMSRVVGGITGGLRGASEPSASNNNQVLTNQLSTNATTTDYFGNDQNTEILDLPPPNLNQSPIGGTLVSPDTTNNGQLLFTPKPNDNDCIGVAQSILDAAAQDIVNNLGGITFANAMLLVDCDPPGIN